MSVTFEGVSAAATLANANDNTAKTVALPPVMPLGGVLLLCTFCKSTTAGLTTSPGTQGYTQLSNVGSGFADSGQVTIWGRIIDGTETAPSVAYNSTTGTSGLHWAACMFSYSGVDTSGGIAGVLDGSVTQNDALSGATCTHPANTIFGSDSMLVRVVTRYRDFGDSFTPTATWNERKDQSSTARTGMNFHWQDKLATSSGVQASTTVAPSSSASSTCLTISFALKATATTALTFPTTGLLDDFNRADGALGANWPSEWWPSGGTLVVGSNAAKPSSSAGSAVWTDTFGPDLEVYAKCSARGSSDIILIGRAHNSGLSNFNGYELVISGISWQFYWIDTGSGAIIGSNINQAVSAGDWVGMDIIGNTLRAYYKPAAGAWSLKMTASDSHFTTAGQIGIEADAADCAWDDFSGGTVVTGASRKPRYRVGPGVAVLRAGTR